MNEKKKAKKSEKHSARYVTYNKGTLTVSYSSNSKWQFQLTCLCLPVNHISQPTAFGVLTRKARGTDRERKQPHKPSNNTTCTVFGRLPLMAG